MRGGIAWVLGGLLGTGSPAVLGRRRGQSMHTGTIVPNGGTVVRQGMKTLHTGTIVDGFPTVVPQGMLRMASHRNRRRDTDDSATRCQTPGIHTGANPNRRRSHPSQAAGPTHGRGRSLSWARPPGLSQRAAPPEPPRLCSVPADTEIAFDERGLVPCIVQDWRTGEVLTLAYMNAEALARTRETGEMHFFSRSRQRAVAQGRDLGQHPGGAGAALRLRRRRAARAGRAGRAGLPHRRAHLLSPRRARAAGAARGAAGARADDRRSAPRSGPTGSYTATLLADPARIGEKVAGGGRGGRARGARGVRRARRRGGGRRALPPGGAAAQPRPDASPTPSGCSMAVAAERTAAGVEPSLEEVARAGARRTT